MTVKESQLIHFEKLAKFDDEETEQQTTLYNKGYTLETTGNIQYIS